MSEILKETNQQVVYLFAYCVRGLKKLARRFAVFSCCVDIAREVI